MKLFVTGGRNFDDVAMLNRELDKFCQQYGTPTYIVHGGATGADKLCDDWARARGIQPVVCEALWEYWGRSAGPIRNQLMVQLRKDGDRLISFPGGAGTASMTREWAYAVQDPEIEAIEAKA